MNDTFSSPSRMLATLACGWLACAVAAGAETQPAANGPEATLPATPVVVDVTPVEGRAVQGTLARLGDGELTLISEPAGRPDVWPLADLLKVEFVRKPSSRRSGGALLLLANGDRLRVDPVHMEDERLVARWIEYPAWPPVSIRLETIRAIVFDLPAILSVRGELISRLESRRGEGDLVLLTRGDQVTGELTGLDDTSVTLRGTVGETSLDRATVQAIAFDPALISVPQRGGPSVLMGLADGSRLTGSGLTLGDGVLEIKPIFTDRLELPLASAGWIRFFGGRAVYLSDLEPGEFRFTPYLARQWPLQRDRNVRGGPLRLRETEYPKGLGMHSRSEVTYSLQGGYRRFQAVAGVDDDARGQGSVVFAVDVDGERVFTSPPQTGKDEPLAVGPLDLTGKKQLTLIVEFGDWADIQDRANWCDAVLLK